jgi:hypothetical protein
LGVALGAGAAVEAGSVTAEVTAVVTAVVAAAVSVPVGTLVPDVLSNGEVAVPLLIDDCSQSERSEQEERI